MQQNPVYRCPVEVWSNIFTFACDQGGRTAAAICAVSRYFHKVIKPHRLKSLVLYGESRIVAFQRAMKIMPPDVPRARHLYIALIPDSYVGDAQEACGTIIGRCNHRRGETKEQYSRRKSRTSALSPFGSALLDYSAVQRDSISGIISQHRETLQTLTYLTAVGHISFEMFGRLPKLKDLTLVSLRYKSTFYAVHRNKPVCQTHQFPSLKRLHLSYFDTEHLFNYDEFCRVAPELTHLRMSGRKICPEYDKLPPRCTRVLMQPVMASLPEQLEQVSQIREIFSKRLDGVETVLLEPGCREEGRYGFFDALLDWLDVSAGGDAFWDSKSMVTPNQLAVR